jgi:hypothetical protein
MLYHPSRFPVGGNRKQRELALFESEGVLARIGDVQEAVFILVLHTHC